MRGRSKPAVAKAALLVTLMAAIAGLQAQSVKTADETSSQPDSPQAYLSTIQVHGDWTVVVRNRDGSVVSTRHFKNAIAAGGSSFFSHLMARTVPSFYWGIRLQNLCGTAPNLSACLIAEPASASDAIASHFYNGAVTSNLTISAPTTGANAFRFVLSGSLTAPNAGQITGVGTETFANSGATDNVSSITATNLQQPIAVQAGQIVDVTVVIGFS